MTVILFSMMEWIITHRSKTYLNIPNESDVYNLRETPLIYVHEHI